MTSSCDCLFEMLCEECCNFVEGFGYFFRGTPLKLLNNFGDKVRVGIWWFVCSLSILFVLLNGVEFNEVFFVKIV